MSSTLSQPPLGLEIHARRQLMQNHGSPIPQSYLGELHSFLREYPDDTKFTIRKGAGYGILSCLEAGCNGVDIPLGVLHGVPLGGIGSLNPYKSHIRVHPTHATSRMARVVAENSQPLGGPQRTAAGGRLLAALSGAANPPRSIQPSTQMGIKSQISQPSSNISRKLPNGVVECIEISSDSEEDDSHRPKRPRLQSPVKQPLGTSNPNTPIKSSAPNFASQKLFSPLKQQPMADVVTAPPVGPTKFKENSMLATAPTQASLQARKSELHNRILHYQLKLMASGQKSGEKAKHDIEKYNRGLTDARTKIAKVDQQLKGLSTPSVPMAGPSSVPMAAYPPSTSQSVPTPTWQDHLGDLATVFAPVGAPLVEDDLMGYDDVELMPQSYPQRPIPAQRIQANARDFHSFLETTTQNWFGGDKTVQDALQGLGLETTEDCLPGMEVSLLAHQVIGVNWMKGREAERAQFTRGGILADAMGLGKTIQTIGIMCANPSDDPNCKSTLIIAPLALLEQWKQEILDKTEEDSMKVLIYHGANRPKHAKYIKKYDVVLTTYHTLANEWPDELATTKKKSKKKKNDDFVVDDASDDGTAAKKKRTYGPLMDINWYRVVLDEAQNIRNARTRSSTAVTHIVSEIKWCLTGTPFTNGLNDAYGLLRFIQHRPFGDWDKFRDLVRGKEDEYAAKRVQSVMAGITLRRTKESELDGRKLIELPPRQEDWVPLEFTEDERAIYAFVEARAQAVFNKFLQAGTVLKNYSQILVMLMRLRQICVHPCLLKAYEDAYEVKDTRPKNAKDVLEEAAGLVSNDYVFHVKKLLRDAALDRMKLEKEKGAAATIEDNCSICFEPHGPAAVVTAPCAHIFCHGCIEAHINKPRTEEDARFKDHERDCPLCRQTISTTKLFARQAFEPTDEELNISGHAEGFNIDWEVDLETGEGHYKAKATGKRKSRKGVVDNYSDLEDFIVNDDEPLDDSYKRGPQRKARAKSHTIIFSDDEEDGSSDKDKTAHGSDSDDLEDIESAMKNLKRKGKAPSKRKAIIDSEEEDKAPKQIRARARVDVVNQPAMFASFLPSTKMQYMMKKLLEVAKTHPDDKTMVLSQWTSALDLCSDYLNENSIKHVTFKGSMSVRERNDAVKSFMKDPKYKVMLMSLKAGGVGLNLTRGNRVMSLDLGWSNAVDQQAFDRVHRLGQKKDVFIERLVINNTVEQRVQAIQARKQGLSDGALGEGTGQRMRMSVGELAHLFGLGPAA